MLCACPVGDRHPGHRQRKSFSAENTDRRFVPGTHCDGSCFPRGLQLYPAFQLAVLLLEPGASGAGRSDGKRRERCDPLGIDRRAAFSAVRVIQDHYHYILRVLFYEISGDAQHDKNTGGIVYSGWDPTGFSCDTAGSFHDDRNRINFCIPLVYCGIKL